MPATFSRTLRSLEADHFRGSFWGLLLIAFLSAAAVAWFLFAHVELYETAPNARLEVDRQVHPVAALVAGRVIKTMLTVGRTVEAGEVLMELDAEAERLRVEEERAHRAAHEARLKALENEMTAEEASWREEQKTARLSIEEGRAKEREAEAAAGFAEGEAKRAGQLGEGGLVAKSDLLRAQTEAQQKRSVVAALNATVQRLEAEVPSKEKGHEARLAKLRSEAALLEGETHISAAAIKRLEYDLEKRVIRAPVAGELGQVAELQIGSFVAEGDRLAAVIPSGQLKAVAYFPPLAALGRIRAGQRARLRLDGFPWTQYGTVAGRVAGVATEPREGKIRVDLSVDSKSAPLIPVQHGLPGTVEITVDRITPAALVLRAAGKILAAPPAHAAAQ